MTRVVRVAAENGTMYSLRASLFNERAFKIERSQISLVNMGTLSPSSLISSCISRWTRNGRGWRRKTAGSTGHVFSGG